MPSRRVRYHGTGHARGCDHLRLGGFSKLFPDLQARQSSRQDAHEEALELAGAGRLMDDADGTGEDCSLPAGYAFLAQMLDHDMILGTEVDLKGEQLPGHKLSKLANLHSPSLDLHCLYGLGPSASALLYDPDEPGCLTTSAGDPPHDLARTERGTPLIADLRNDENLVLSQLHLLWIRFANKVFRQARDSGVDRPFETAQTKVRHHYQYLVVHDLLRRVCAPAIHGFALERLKVGKYPVFYQRDALQSFSVPIELSAAALRFGHTLLRARYRVNSEQGDIDLMDLPMIDDQSPAVPAALAVDWRYFFEVDSEVTPNRCKAFDLRYCHEVVAGSHPGMGETPLSLPYRDLLRGHVLGLPNGLQVAEALRDRGYPIDPEADLGFHQIKGWDNLPTPVRRRLLTSPPLLFFLLREAEVLGGKQHLGPVGSAILLEAVLGVLSGCKTSFLNPKWKFKLDPEIAPRLSALGDRKLDMADIVRFTESA